MKNYINSQFIKALDFVIKRKSLLVVVIGICSVLSLIGARYIFVMFYNTAEYWTPYFVSTAVLAAVVLYWVYKYQQEKKLQEQAMLNTRSGIAAEFLRQFFFNHSELPLKLEKLVGLEEYRLRMYFNQYNSLQIFSLKLADMSCGEVTDKKRRQLLIKQLNFYVRDFFADGEYVLPRYQSLEPIAFTKCSYNDDENVFKIQFVFIGNARQLNDYIHYRDDLQKAEQSNK